MHAPFVKRYISYKPKNFEPLQHLLHTEAKAKQTIYNFIIEALPVYQLE